MFLDCGDFRLNVICFVYPRSTKELSRNSFKGDRAFQVELEFSGREKNTRSRDENQELNPDHIGGRRVLNHCAIPNPQGFGFERCKLLNFYRRLIHFTLRGEWRMMQMSKRTDRIRNLELEYHSEK